MADPTLLFAHTVSPDRTDALRAPLAERLPDGALANATTPRETEERIRTADGVVVGRFEEAWLDAAERLEWVQALSAGVDFLPLDAIEDAGVALTNASGVHAEPIAEQVLAYVLSFERGLVEAGRNQHRGVWERVEGGELRGKTLGIVGVGAIGSRVAQLGSALGMEVLGTKRDTDERPDGVDELFEASAYPTLCRRADYLVLACPLTDRTEGLVGMDELRLLGGDGVLVNIARGDVVVQEELVRALQYGIIEGAALDVFSEEPLPAESVLWDLSNVVVTPHMAGSTPHKDERWVDIIAENYAALADGDREAMVNRVL
jgi:phosphoglycerate dehydrogenase-like enzyme